MNRHDIMLDPSYSFHYSPPMKGERIAFGNVYRRVFLYTDDPSESVVICVEQNRKKSFVMLRPNETRELLRRLVAKDLKQSDSVVRAIVDLSNANENK